MQWFDEKKKLVEERLDLLIKLLEETDDVFNTFRKFWKDYYRYRENFAADREVSTIRENMQIFFGQLDILQMRFENLAKFAKTIKNALREALGENSNDTQKG